MTSSYPQLLNELKGLAEYGLTHTAEIRGTHCDLCGMRMPCDWAEAGDTARQAADEIESLRAENDDMARHLADGIAIIQQLQKREGGT